MTTVPPENPDQTPGDPEQPSIPDVTPAAPGYQPPGLGNPGAVLPDQPISEAISEPFDEPVVDPAESAANHAAGDSSTSAYAPPAYGAPGDSSYAPPAPPAQPAYGAPSYGAPGQPAYGAQPQQPYGGYEQQAPFNVMGIVSLVLSLIGISIGGVVFGHIGLSQIKKKGERGRGVALAGLIIGYVGCALWILFWILWGWLIAIAATSSSYTTY